MIYSQKELEFIVDRIEKQTFELNEWEKGFFQSVSSKIKSGVKLSNNQKEKLSEIWDKLS